MIHKKRYRQGRVGDVEVKRKLARALNDFLDPIRERRAHYAAQPDLVEDILVEGTMRMQVEARKTMGLVYEGENRFTLFYTGFEQTPDWDRLLEGRGKETCAVGLVELRFSRS